MIKLGKLRLDPRAIASQGNAPRSTNDPVYARAWALKNAAHLKRYRADYYLRNKDRQRASAQAKRGTAEALAMRRAYRRKNRDHINQLRRDRRQQEPELIRARERASKLKDRPRKRMRDAIWRANNREQAALIVRRSKDKKPDLYREHAVQGQARRRARRKAAAVERFRSTQIYARDRNTCHLCGNTVAIEARSIDHLIPIARNGAHARWNVATAHIRCNQRRNVRQILFPETREQAELYLRGKVA